MTDEVKLDLAKLENIDFALIVVSSIMIVAGIGFGSFVPGTIVLSILGSFLIMVGIILYIAMQFKSVIEYGKNAL
jgi:hypothetical protein